MVKTLYMARKFGPLARFRIFVASACLTLAPTASPLYAQKPLPPAAGEPPHRIHLMLRDGSYQIVTSYRIVGANVSYISAERGGAEEIIPLSLVDLDATRKWEQSHTRDASGALPAPAIDPELVKEEADRAAQTPEVAPDLNLPEQDSVLALDTFQGTPELVPLAQSSGELNRNTAHNVLRAAINPLSASHQVVELRGFRSAVQLHVPDPVLYIRVGDDTGSTGGGSPLTVDTHGASGQAPTASAGGSAGSRYVIVRADVRTDSRIVASFNISFLGTAKRQEHVVETTAETLPGGHWMKVTPKEPLQFGEYALMEIINDREINTGVWDFGIHPVAPENRDAIKPEAKRPFALGRRPRE